MIAVENVFARAEGEAGENFFGPLGELFIFDGGEASALGNGDLGNRNVAGFEGGDEGFVPDRTAEENRDRFVAEGRSESLPAGEEFGGDGGFVEGTEDSESSLLYFARLQGR